MREPYGEKRLAIEELLYSGTNDYQIADEVGCSRTWVVGVRKELHVERPRGKPNVRERVEQLIAREWPDDRIAKEVGRSVAFVAGVRRSMDLFVEREDRRAAC